MRNRIVMGGAALLALMLAGGNAAAEGESLMEKLKGLEGDWTMLDENGEDTGVIGSTFRISSGGSVLVEVMAPDSPDGHEMFNMYHADGERVLMTHYCAAGNQPRLEVIATDEGNRLELRFESITNLASPDTGHMHQAEYIFHGDDRLTTRWQSMQDGKLSDEHAVFELKRRK